MKKTLSSLMLIVAVTIFSSCTKKGDIGPAGAAGTPGNANVTNIFLTTTSSNWTVGGTGVSYFVDFTVLGITKQILDKGTVQVFLAGSSNSDPMLSLPTSFKNDELNFLISENKLTILSTSGNGTLPSNPGDCKFKVVIIAGS